MPENKEVGAAENSDDVLPLELAVADYIRACENGTPPSRQELLARHPEWAEDLRQFFSQRDHMNSLAAQHPPGTPRLPGSRGGRIQYLGDYELLEEIGFGGMGVIYKARQTSLQRMVAVKMILDGHMSSPEDRQRFRIEAEAAASLERASILPIYEVGEHEGRQYFSMKLVEGGSLSQRLATGPLPAREAASLLIRLARAVHFAHQRGILHRDLKPANILLDTEGLSFVSDFGLAKQLKLDRELTHTGAVLGTPSYMAPEQAAGQSRRVTIATDVYGLGAILYAALSGRPPFQAENVVETLRQVLDGEPERPSAFHQEVDRDLDTICLKALQKEPSRRYASAEALARDLERYLAGEPVQARPISSWAQAWRWCRRKPAVASLAALLVTAVIAITTSTTVAYLRELAHREEIENQNEKIGRALEGEKTSNKTAMLRLYRSLVAQARANRLSRRIGQRFQSLETLKEASRMAHEMALPEEELYELRNEAIACLTLADLNNAQEWEGWPSGSSNVDFDSALERYARIDRAGTISVRKVAGDVELFRLTGLGPRETWPNLSPDGRFLIVWNSHFKLWDLSTAEPTLLAEGVGHCPVFRPDSRQMALKQDQGLIQVFVLPAGTIITEFPVVPQSWKLAYHPHLPQLAVSSTTGVQILNIDTGKLITHLPQGGATELEWHPDGKTLAVVGDDSNIHCWDVAAGKLIVNLVDRPDGGTRFAFHPSGKMLASTGWYQPLRLWNPQTGDLLFQTPIHMERFLRFTPTGTRLAVASPGNGRLRLFDVADAESYYRTLVRDPILGRGFYDQSAISPNGRLLAAAMPDGLALWDLVSGNPLTFLPAAHLKSVRFEPSGAVLAGGHGGLLRWTIDVDSPTPGFVHVGESESLSFGERSEELGMSRDGRVLAQARLWGGAVWNRDEMDAPLRLVHGDTRYIDVSPDGAWVATGSHHGNQARIWDARTGTVAHELPTEGLTYVVFSADGRMLITGSDGNRLWSVESGRELRYIGGRGGVDFSSDGSLLAVETGSATIRLMNPVTGQEYALLEDPRQDRANNAKFADDGTLLTVTTQEGAAIHVWNLRAIRAKLSEMGLDWDLPPYPPAETAAPLTMAPLPLPQPAPKAPPAPSLRVPTGFASWTPQAMTELSLIGVGDGHFESIMTGDQESIEASGFYLYFRIDDGFVFDIPPDCPDEYWLEVSLRDIRRTTVDVHYDAQESLTPIESQWTESPKKQTNGNGEWKSLVFELPRPRFANRQNGGGDFRLRAFDKGALEIRSVRLYRSEIALAK